MFCARGDRAVLVPLREELAGYLDSPEKIARLISPGVRLPVRRLSARRRNQISGMTGCRPTRHNDLYV